MKIHKSFPVCRKAGRKVTSHLRHLAMDAGMSGTKSLMFRAGRYSVHQFLKSFTALFAALLIVPKAIRNSVQSFMKRDRHWGGFSGFFSGISGAIKGAFMGIPSVFRSGFAALKLQLYGCSESIYHFFEAIKASFLVVTGKFGHFNEVVGHAFSAVTANLKASMSAISLFFLHLFQYVSSVFQSFKTGTSNAVHVLWEKEKNWGVHVYEKIDHGRDYVSKGLSRVLAPVSAAFAKIWEYIMSFCGGFKQSVGGFAADFGHKVHDKAASAGNKTKVVIVDVSHKVHDAAVDVGHIFQKVHHKAADVRHKVHDKAVDVRHNVHDAAVHGLHSIGDAEHKVVVKVKTTAEMIRAKASDMATGVKVGTVQIVHKLKDGVPIIQEKAILVLRTTKTRGKELVYIGLARSKHAAAQVKTTLSKGSQDLVKFFGSLGKKVNSVFVTISRPFVYPVVYFYHLPGRALNSVSGAPVSAYLYLLSVIGFVSYLGYSIKLRYERERYARKLGVHKKVRNGCQEFNLSDSVLHQCMEKLRAQIDLGLNPSTKEQSSVKCFNTYVQDLPTGKEKGQFLALDLGGTNFRVLLITLNGRHFDMQSKIYVVPKEIMMGPGEALFDHIASCLESFALQHRVAKKNLPLGFTFSFPLNQVGLKSGILTRWTKGFNCANTIGEDVVQMLAAALAKRDTVKIDVVAILNDTTGTLMSCAWKNHNCKVGVILGTGSNACYVEKIKNVIGFDGDTSKPHVIINTEWGAFGDHGELDFIRTPYDKDIDKHSVNPGKQLHEKMISGMYLGELARLLIVKFTKDKILFGGQSFPKLQERWSFLTEYISDIESDPRGVFKQCRNVLGKLNILDPTDQDCSNIRYICESVSRRAAYLASAGVATLINKMDIPSVTVGVDGSLYRFHPHFHNLMHEKIPELCSPNIENLCVNLMLSEDGSGRGAALIAASGSEHKSE